MYSPAEAHSRPRRFRLLRRLLGTLALRQSRAQLARLDDRLLKDIGVSLEDARAEAGRPIWDAPAHWRAPTRGRAHSTLTIDGIQTEILEISRHSANIG